MVPRVGIIEIPLLSPWWLGGVGGGVFRGRPGKKPPPGLLWTPGRRAGWFRACGSNSGFVTPCFAPVRAGRCSATLTGALPRTLAVLEVAPRAGIIEIPPLFPRWVGGVGGGVFRGRPGPETSAWTSLNPWSPCRLVQSVWLRILGCYPLLDLTVLIADWKSPVGRLDRSSVRRLAHNCVGERVGFRVGSRLKEKREICDNL